MINKTKQTFEVSLIIDDLSCNQSLDIRENILELIKALNIKDKQYKLEINDLEQSITVHHD